MARLPLPFGAGPIPPSWYPQESRKWRVVFDHRRRHRPVAIRRMIVGGVLFDRVMLDIMTKCLMSVPVGVRVATGKDKWCDDQKFHHVSFRFAAVVPRWPIAATIRTLAQALERAPWPPVSGVVTCYRRGCGARPSGTADRSQQPEISFSTTHTRKRHKVARLAPSSLDQLANVTGSGGCTEIACTTSTPPRCGRLYEPPYTAFVCSQGCPICLATSAISACVLAEAADGESKI